MSVFFRRSKRDQIDLEIFEMLQTLTDFLEFKQMFLNYKAVGPILLDLSSVRSKCIYYFKCYC